MHRARSLILCRCPSVCPAPVGPKEFEPSGAAIRRSSGSVPNLRALQNGFARMLLPLQTAQSKQLLGPYGLSQTLESESLFLPASCAGLLVLCAVATLTGHTRGDPLIKDDVVVLGLIAIILQSVYMISSSLHPFLIRVNKFLPSLLLCYFVPGALASAGVFSSQHSLLPDVAARYLLPACLVLLTLGTDIPSAAQLGPMVLGCFGAATVSIVAGGPIAFVIVGLWNRNLVAGDTWRGLATMAGSWIGGSPNQLAMKAIWGCADDEFSRLVAVDVLVSNVWMAGLMASARYAADIDAFLGADSSSISQLTRSLEGFNVENLRVTSYADWVALSTAALGSAGLSTWAGHALARRIALNFPLLHAISLDSPVFWIMSFATAIGVCLSLTKARSLDGAGASKLGSYLLLLVAATLGLKLDLSALTQTPGLMAVATVWIALHGAAMFWLGLVVKAPFFFLAIGSQANIGGAASAPLVAAAFNPALAPIGVLLAVLGYSIGTVAAYLTGLGFKAAAHVLGVAVAVSA